MGSSGMNNPNIVKSHQLQDFLGINWSGKDLHFMISLPDFLKVVIPQLYRAPEFAPEPPVFDSEEDSIAAEETPFETYIYLMGFRSHPCPWRASMGSRRRRCCAWRSASRNSTSTVVAPSVYRSCSHCQN